MSESTLSASLMFEAALRVSGLILTTWALVAILRIRNPAHERTVWLCVLAVALALPFVGPLAASTVSAFQSVAGVGQLSLGNAVPLLNRFLNILWPLYFGGAIVLLLRVVAGLVMVQRLWRAATPVPSLSSDTRPVRSSHRVKAPMVTNAGILLPRSWTHWGAEQLEWVLAHERSHMERRDFHWQVLAHVYRALFWISPMTWWHVRRITLLAEHLSDEAALARNGKPVRYAAVLLKFSTPRPSGVVAVGMARVSDLSRRIERVLDVRSRSAARAPLGAHVGALLTIGVVALAIVNTMSPWYRIDTQAATSSALSPALSPLTPTLGRLGNLEPLGPMK